MFAGPPPPLLLLVVFCVLGGFVHQMECHSIPTTAASVPFKIGQPEQLYTDKPGRPLDENDFRRARKIDRGGEIAVEEGDTDPIELSGHFQGDIIFNDIEEYQALTSSKETDYGLRNAIANLEKRWPRAEIPYLISAVFDDQERAKIASAVMIIHNQTCIRFRPREREQDYVHILKADGCSSSVGRTGGPQTISLGSGCFYNQGIIMHELMHTTGFWHEHSRSDRDEHIQVIWSNIKEGMKSNFEKYDWSTIQSLGVDYDLGSIMHYGAYAFARDKTKPTIIPRKRIEIGQRRHFSKRDVKKMNILYNCPGATPPPVPCLDDDGYCEAWAILGECDKNPKWMNTNCRKSCKRCKADQNCDDMHVHCKSWATAGECSSNPKYMLIYCQHSCRSCL